MKKFLSAFFISIFFCLSALHGQFLITGNNLAASANRVTAGDDSSAYITGDFMSYEIANPSGPAITSYNLKIGDSTAVCDSCGYEHFSNKIYVSKISKTGNTEWIRIAKSCDTSSLARIVEISTDADNNLLILGIFRGNAELEGFSLSTSSLWDMFLYKISPDGTILWQKAGFAQGSATEVHPEDLLITGNEIHVSGSYTGNALFAGENFHSTQSQFFLLRLDQNGNELEIKAGIGCNTSSFSALHSVDYEIAGDVNGILTVEDSVLVIDKLQGFPMDTIYALTSFEKKVLYVIDSADLSHVSAVADSFSILITPDSIRWYYLAEAAAIELPSIVIDSVFRNDTDRPLRLHHISIFRNDSLELSEPVPAVPLDFRVDHNDNSLYALYNYSLPLDFGTTQIPAPAFPSALIVKHRLDGGTEWIKRAFCNDDTVQASSFDIDKNSDLYIAGSVGKQEGSHVLNFDGQSFAASQDEDAFVLKLESGSPAWCQIIGDSASDMINDLYVSDRFHILASGAFSKRLEYNQFTIQTSGVRELFLACIDPFPSFDLNLVSHRNEALPLCEGDSVLLTGHTSHASVFQWMKDSIPIPGENRDSLWVTTSGFYSLKAASLSISGDDMRPYTKTTKPVELLYNPYPDDSIIISDTTVFCFGEETGLKIETGAGDSCSWYSLTGGYMASENHFITGTAGSYYARIESLHGCVSVSDTVEITVIPVPGDSLRITGGNYMFCAGDSVEIESTDPGNNIYTWFINGDSLTRVTTATISFGSGGEYFVEILNDRNCSVRSDTITLTEIEPPLLQQWFDESESGICRGEVSEIRLSQHGQCEYTWFFNGDTVFNNNSAVLYASEEGSYHAEVVKEGVCFLWSDTFQLAVHEIPFAGLEIQPDSVVCDNDKVLLSVTSPEAENYYWYRNGELLADSVSSSIHISENGIYYAEVANAFSCKSSTRSVSVLVKKAPHLKLLSEEGRTIFCMGDSLRLTVENSSGILYQWQLDGQPLPARSPFLYASESGQYSVILSDTLSGCNSLTNTLELNRRELPDPSFHFNELVPLCDRDTIMLVSGASAESYTWFRNGEELILETGNSMKIYRDGSYFLEIKDIYNCTSGSEPRVFDFLENPVPPASQDRDYLFTTDFDHLQWYRNDEPLSGANGQVYLVKESGYYHVEVRYENGCRADSKEIRVCIPLPGIDVNHNILTATEGESYQWYYGQDTIFGANEAIYEAQLTGKYSLDIRLSDGCVSRSESVEVCYPVPEIEVLTVPVLVLKSSLGLSYQWYRNDKVIEGADARMYVVDAGGNYKVEVESLEHCISISDPVFMETSVVHEFMKNKLNFYPNPAKDGVNVILPEGTDTHNLLLRLLNPQGIVIREYKPETSPCYFGLDGFFPEFTCWNLNQARYPGMGEWWLCNCGCSFSIPI